MVRDFGYSENIVKSPIARLSGILVRGSSVLRINNTIANQ